MVTNITDVVEALEKKKEELGDSIREYKEALRNLREGEKEEAKKALDYAAEKKANEGCIKQLAAKNLELGKILAQKQTEFGDAKRELSQEQAKLKQLRGGLKTWQETVSQYLGLKPASILKKARKVRRPVISEAGDIVQKDVGIVIKKPLKSPIEQKLRHLKLEQEEIDRQIAEVQVQGQASFQELQSKKIDLATNILEVEKLFAEEKNLQSEIDAKQNLVVEKQQLIKDKKTSEKATINALLANAEDRRRAEAERDRLVAAGNVEQKQQELAQKAKEIALNEKYMANTCASYGDLDAMLEYLKCFQTKVVAFVECAVIAGAYHQVELSKGLTELQAEYKACLESIKALCAKTDNYALPIFFNAVERAPINACLSGLQNLKELDKASGQEGVIERAWELLNSCSKTIGVSPVWKVIAEALECQYDADHTHLERTQMEHSKKVEACKELDEHYQHRVSMHLDSYCKYLSKIGDDTKTKEFIKEFCVLIHPDHEPQDAILKSAKKFIVEKISGLNRIKYWFKNKFGSEGDKALYATYNGLGFSAQAIATMRTLMASAASKIAFFSRAEPGVAISAFGNRGGSYALMRPKNNDASLQSQRTIHSDHPPEPAQQPAPMIQSR